MKRLFEALMEELKQNRETVLATIIKSAGSTPRSAGSHMLVRRDGTILGSVGGGIMEFRAMQTALEAMREKRSFLQSFSLTRGGDDDIGMVCGGDAEIFFQYMDPEAETLPALCAGILDALERDEDSWLLLDLTDPADWRMGVYSRSSSAVGMELPAELAGFSDFAEAGSGGMKREGYYVEPLQRAGNVCVFGGGHVAQELVPLLQHLGFRCIVMDDREEFANSRTFPQAERVIVGNLERISDYLKIRPCDYVCVMTRGHQSDYDVQKQALAARPRYIGIMGSRNKIRVMTEKLLKDGFSLEEIRSCHMPIGVAIRSETPAEIAVSIAAELIAVRAESSGDCR